MKIVGRPTNTPTNPALFGGATDAQVSAAVAEYLAEHPVTGGATAEQAAQITENKNAIANTYTKDQADERITEMVNSALGVIENGTY